MVNPDTARHHSLSEEAWLLRLVQKTGDYLARGPHLNQFGEGGPSHSPLLRGRELWDRDGGKEVSIEMMRRR